MTRSNSWCRETGIEFDRVKLDISGPTSEYQFYFPNLRLEQTQFPSTNEFSERPSATRATQRLYSTSLATRESRVARTVVSADQVSHSVDRPRAFLHVLRATGSAQIRQSPEQSIPVMHALESELNLIIRKCPGWILSESVRIPVYWYRYEYI